jgi:hypothetical protein|tara:strand:+ start:19 stop:192 length:174 start_codon:yes stop_codon:yes gene_type:complete
MKDEIYDVAYLGLDDQGQIIKIIKVVATSPEEAFEQVKEIAQYVNIRNVYSAIKQEQ